MLSRLQVCGQWSGLVRSLGLAGVVVAGAAACGDATAPWSEFAPERVADRLDGVLTPLAGDGDLLLGLDLAVATIEAESGVSLAAALSVRPADGDAVLRSLRTVRAERDREGAPGQGSSVEASHDSAVSGFTIPWSLAGETLEWEPGYGYVVSGRTGASSHGVRIFLYRMNSSTGYPAEPLSRVGYIDLTDEDSGQAEAVRVRAIGTVGPDRLLADYLVSLTGSGSYDEGSMTVTTRGVMAQAGSVELHLSQELEWSRSRDQDRLVLDYGYRQGSRAVVIEGLATARYNAAEWETFDFSTAIEGERPSTEVEAMIGRDGRVRGEILSDGRRVVRIGGYDGQPTFERADGGGLSWAETEGLERIWTGITDLVWWTDWVVIPADLLILSG